MFGGVILAIINPVRSYFLLDLFKKLKFKYHQKRIAQQRPFFEEEFAQDLRTLVKDVAKETKEDLLCWVAVGIIFFGVYEIQETYERTKKLLTYRWRHSELYRWLNRPKKEQLAPNQGDQILLERVNWMTLVSLGEFLSMQDRLKITMLNKKLLLEHTFHLDQALQEPREPNHRRLVGEDLLDPDRVSQQVQRGVG